MDKSNDNSHALPRLSLGVQAKNKRPDLWISPRWRFSSARGWPTSARRSTSRWRGGCSRCPNSPTVATEERFPLPAVLPSFPPSQGFLRTDKFFVDQTHHERIAEILPTCQLPCRPKGRAFSSDWFFVFPSVRKVKMDLPKACLWHFPLKTTRRFSLHIFTIKWTEIRRDCRPRFIF